MSRTALLRPARPCLTRPTPAEGLPGALVISLDFELHWGVRDKHPSGGGSYRENLLGARAAVPRMLALFEKYKVSATWATVGLLFARDRRDLLHFRPAVLPDYREARLSPFDEPVGEGEEADPLHYASGLIRQIASTETQEVATHTYSHYYCLEPGQTEAAFRADLASAAAIARREGVTLRSIVFPRNQVNPAYEQALRDAGIVAYRSNEQGWMYRYHDPSYGGGRLQRVVRKADAYLNLSGRNLVGWDELDAGGGLYRVPSSRFLRPYSSRLRHLEPLKYRRIVQDLKAAAVSGRIYHLWWHPHNFGRQTDRNLDGLEWILRAFDDCRRRYGMTSLSMSGVAELARHA